VTHAFRTSLHELRRICGAHETLPKSSTIPDSLQIGPSVDPGYAQEGILNGANIRIKSVRVYSNEDPRRAKKVSRRPHCPPHSPVLTKPTGLQPTSRSVETLEPPKYYPPSGCHYRPSPTRFGLDTLWGPRGLHHGPRGRGQTWPRRYSPYCATPLDAEPIISCMTLLRG